MKLMTRINLGFNIMFIAGILWFLETWFFGWNMTPINIYELWADRFVYILFYIGVFYVLNPLYEIYYKTCMRIDKE